MNRFQVIEAFVDDNNVRMQALNLHPSCTSAYFYYPSHSKGEFAINRLKVIDIKRQVVFDWQHCEMLMLLEGLNKVINNRALDNQHSITLHAHGLITVSGDITTKGNEFYLEHTRPAQIITLNHIKSDTTLKLGG